MEGSTRWCNTSSIFAKPSRSTDTSIRPPMGKIGRVEENSIISMIPVQKTGAE